MTSLKFVADKNNIGPIVLFLLSLFFINKSFSHECIPFDKVKTILEGYPNKPIKEIEEDITLESAYCVQEKLNYLIKKKYNDKIGYKVGFTGKATQERFKIDTPAVGTLYKHMFIKNNTKLSHSFGFRPLIEPDLMVIVKSKKIMAASNNLEILAELETLHPFIEIASLRFENNIKVNGNMLVAANMLATKMVMGEGINIQPTKAFLKKIGKIRTVFLDGNGNVIQEEPASNLMQNPINVMAWLIKNLKEKGISLKKGDRISLGSVGKLFPLKKETAYTYVLKGFDEELSLSISIN